MYAFYHGDKSKERALRHYEPLSVDEMKTLVPRSTIYIENTDGDMPRCRVTSVKTWKTRPDDVRVRLAYGLFEHYEASTISGVSTCPIYKEVVGE